MFEAVEDARASRESLTSETPSQTIENIVDRTWGGDVDAPPLAIPRLGGSVAYWSIRIPPDPGLGSMAHRTEIDGPAVPPPKRAGVATE